MTDEAEMFPDAPIDPQGLLAADLAEVPKERWPRELVRAIEVIESAMKLAGYDDVEAFTIAQTAILAMADYNGGRQLYFPRGDALKIALRDATIYRRAHRGNVRALSEEFGLSDRHIWRIVSQQLRLHRRKIQMPLFGEGAG